MSYSIWDEQSSEDRATEFEDFKAKASNEKPLVFLVQERNCDSLPELKDIFHFALSDTSLYYFLEFIQDYDYGWGFDVPYWNGYTWDGEKLLHVFHYQLCKKLGWDCEEELKVIFKEKGIES